MLVDARCSGLVAAPRRCQPLRMSWRHVLGVFVSVVSAFVLTLALSALLGLAALAYFTVTNLTAQQMDFPHLSTSPPVLLASLGLGGFAMLVGGYIAGCIARTGQVVTGLITGIASTVLSIPFFFWYPPWYDAACIVATVGPAAMGGYWARVTASSQRASSRATS